MIEYLGFIKLFYSLVLEINDVITSPTPNPTSKHATNQSTFELRKKKPAPSPAIIPPPIAQSLLSFVFDINFV